LGQEQQVKVENGQVVEYQVNLLVTFVLEAPDVHRPT
jgi:flavin-binding protein dodecin